MGDASDAIAVLVDLDAFLGEHRRCGDLDGGVDDCAGGPSSPVAQ